jgi:kynurenine formamidase
MTPVRPRYRDLPDGRADGVFGDGDALGCLNLLTAERVAAAAWLVRRGRVFGLNGALGSWPDPSPAGRTVRPRHTHTVLELVPGVVRDDVIDGFQLQGGTQWDGFLHMIDPATGASYNGADTSSPGVAAWAQRGIAGRAVLLDVARWAADVGRPFHWCSRTEITPEDLVACARHQDVRVTEGTILLVRVGWQEGYARLTDEERRAHSPADPADRVPVPGLSPDVAMAELLWDWGVAAVASDNPSLEVTPYEVGLADSLHTLLLARLGMPLGELWLLDELAAACRAEARYEMLLTSAPLRLEHGVGTPANALAVM